jgi:hypothetical protein
VLRRNPGFSAAVVLSLGLGIGANTAIFTLLDAVLWRMLPVRNPEHLLIVGLQQGTDVGTGFNYSGYRLLHENNGLADVAGYTTAPINVSVDGPPEPSIQGQLVSGGYFPLLGVNAAIGRALGPDDDRVPNGHPVVMLSHGYWERRFAGDPSVVGRTIRLSAVPFTIVGVTPAEFFGVETGTAPDRDAVFRESSRPADRQQELGASHRAHQARCHAGTGGCRDGRGTAESGGPAGARSSRQGASGTPREVRADAHGCGVLTPSTILAAPVRPPGDGWRRAADRLRQYRQSASGAGLGAAS